VYRAVGGTLLGKTPGAVRVARSAQRLPLLFRFPAGERVLVEVIPERPTVAHARAGTR
jgi:hypothetical protein